MRASALMTFLAGLATAAVLTIATPAAAATTSCSSAPSASGEWPVYGHDPANTRSQPDEHALGPQAAATLAPAWTFSTASANDAAAFQTTPVVDRGCVFIGSTNAVVYALRASDGKLAWERWLPRASAAGSWAPHWWTVGA
jgi:polyvinyl alcohol dehydrogenase (cytochrome)